VVLFRKNKQLLQANDEEHRTQRGELAFRQDFDCSEKNEASPILLRLPAKLVPKDDRKPEALVYVYSQDGEFLEEYKPFDVHFPKP